MMLQCPQTKTKREKERSRREERVGEEIVIPSLNPQTKGKKIGSDDCSLGLSFPSLSLSPPTNLNLISPFKFFLCRCDLQHLVSMESIVSCQGSSQLL